MIYTEHQLKEMIIEMIDNFENEVWSCVNK